MSDKTKVPGYEIFEQALKNYEQALHAGLKLQQESARWWMDTMSQAGSPQDWQGKVNTMASDSLGTIQKRMEENLRLLESSSRTSLDLLKKAMEVGQAGTASAGQSKMQELWEASLSAVRTNATAVLQANAKWMDSWTQFMPKAQSAAAKPTA